MSVKLATIVLERRDRVLIATVTGEVDLSNAEEIRRELLDGMSSDDVALVLDVSGLAFIDSSGLHSLFDVHVVLGEHDQELILVVPREGQPSRTIDIVGMRQVIASHEDREAAVAAAEAIER
jgi:anti-anti-sigma factor